MTIANVLKRIIRDFFLAASEMTVEIFYFGEWALRQSNPSTGRNFDTKSVLMPEKEKSNGFEVPDLPIFRLLMLRPSINLGSISGSGAIEVKD